MAQGKATPGDSGKRPPKTSTRVQGSSRASPVNGDKRAAKGAPDEMEGLFVDPAPAESKRSSRAADRRRERGQAPQVAGQPDTRTSLPRKDEPGSAASASASAGSHRGSDRASESDRRGGGSAMSELNPQTFARAHLQCTRGPEEGLSLNLIEGSYTIGRARENSFVLKDIAASRRHMRIEVDGRGARVIDLGSGNGTRVNGKRIAEHELKHGDRIEIGGSVLQFVDKNANASPESGGVDDAQERVIRAAEKLAAELSQRMRFGDGSGSGFEDGHVAKTQAIPQATKDKLTAEIKRQQQAQAQQQPQKAEKLWKETFTNLPLNQVVAADEPLRGARAAESAMLPPSPPVVNTRNPLPRPAPLPMPPMPDEEIDLSASSSRGGGSFVMSLLVTTLVVVLGGGLVFTFWALTRGRGGEQLTEAAAQEEYDRAMQKCLEAYSAGEWLRSYEAATLALQLVPGDVMARRYQADARERIDAATRAGAPPPTGTPVPDTPGPPGTNPAIAGAPAPNAPNGTAPNGAAANGAAANGAAPNGLAPNGTAPNGTPPSGTAPNVADPNAPVGVVPAGAVPPAPTPVGVVAAPPAPAPAPAPVAAPPKPKPAPREAAPRPKPKPPTRGAMSDATAQGKFSDAVDALRDKDTKKGCRLLEEIADKAPPDSRWKEKAENLYSRRCD